MFNDITPIQMSVTLRFQLNQMNSNESYFLNQKLRVLIIYL